MPIEGRHLRRLLASRPVVCTSGNPAFRAELIWLVLEPEADAAKSACDDIPEVGRTVPDMFLLNPADTGESYGPSNGPRKTGNPLPGREEPGNPLLGRRCSARGDHASAGMGVW